MASDANNLLEPTEAAYRTVAELYQGKAKSLQLQLCGGVNGLEKRITSPRIQKLGLALAGYTDYLHPGRVQFVGRTEWNLLEKLSGSERDQALGRPFNFPICCIVVSAGVQPPDLLQALAKESAVPLLLTPLPSLQAIDEVTEFLEQKLAPSTTIHAGLADVFGLGVLITGKSGIGKSECALELVMRGHRLVSDDFVVIRRHGSEQLVGSGPDHLRFHTEVRGLGIINVRDIFGISSVSAQKQIDMVIEMVDWSDQQEEDRLGFEDRKLELLDVHLPLVRLPVASGRNLAALVEVAVRIQLLKKQGYHPAQDFLSELGRKLKGTENGHAD